MGAESWNNELAGAAPSGHWNNSNHMAERDRRILYKVWKSSDLFSWSVARDWTNALTPPVETLKLDLSPTNGFFKVGAEIQ